MSLTYYGINCDFDDLMKMFPRIKQNIINQYQISLDNSKHKLSDILTKCGVQNDVKSTNIEDYSDILIYHYNHKIIYYEKQIKKVHDFYISYKLFNYYNNVLLPTSLKNTPIYDLYSEFFGFFPINIDDIYIYPTDKLRKFIVGCEIGNNDNNKMKIYIEEIRKKLNNLTDKKPTFINVSADFVQK